MTLSRKYKITAATIAGVLGLYALAGFYLLPALLLHKLPALLTESTGQYSRLDAVEFNPFNLQLDLHGFSFGGKPAEPASAGTTPADTHTANTTQPAAAPDKTPADQLLSFASLHINVNGLASLKTLGLVIDDIALTHPQLHVQRQADGRFNFSNLLPAKPATATPPQPASPPPAVLLRQLTLSDGQLDWLDKLHDTARSESLSAINFALHDLSITGATTPAKLELALAVGGGGKLQWLGDLNMQPLASKGQLNLDGLSLPKIWQLFLQDSLPLEITQGNLGLHVEYQLSVADKGTDVLISNSSVALNQLTVTDKTSHATLLTLPATRLSGIAVDPRKHLLSIAELSSSDARIAAVLQADGRLNYQTLFATPATTTAADSTATTPAPAPAETQAPAETPAPAPAPAPAQAQAETPAPTPTPTPTPPPAEAQAQAQPNTQPPPAPATPNWQINVGELAIKNYAVDFSDQSRKTPQNQQLSAINVDLRHYSSQPGSQSPLQFSAVPNNSGKLQVKANVGLSPLTASADIDVNGFKIKAFQDYLRDYLALDLLDGEFNSHGHLQMQKTDNLQLTFQGDANLNNLLTRDKISNKDFLKWGDLQFQQINADVGKQTYSVDKVLFDRPYLRLIIQKNRTTNIGDLQVKHPAAPAPTPANAARIKPTNAARVKPANVGWVKQRATQRAEPAPANAARVKQSDTQQTTPTPVITIGQIEFKDGHSDFADYSLILPFVADMDDLDGDIKGYSNAEKNPVKLSLQGKVYNIAQVVIKGTYLQSNGDSNIDLKFTHMPLPLITPYMADFAGYKIEKGQMSLDLKYKIDKGQLSAENKIFIDQLTLGDKVENPHASSLPLHLAIALLKDADGKINLDFPITGSLNDPQFSLGGLISDVISNFISKLVSSPFKALGSLFDNQESDHSSIAFIPGKADFKAGETAKLDQLSQALQNKPALTLDIKGMAYQNQDWPPMRFEAMTDILKKMKSGELRDKGEQLRSEYVQLSDDEYRRLLAKFFKELFPKEIEFSLFGKPRIKAQPDADFYEVARQKLESIMAPEPQRLNDLAIARANAISRYLVEKTGLDLNRIYMLAPELNTGDAQETTAILSLNVAH